MGMVVMALSKVEQAIRACWAADTCDPVDLADWSPQNPARGQCGVTALVLRDLLGGELLLATVLRADGTRQGVHYWNRFAGRIEVDLTREQFTADEIIQTPVVVTPPSGEPGRLRAQYLLLRRRVHDALVDR